MGSQAGRNEKIGIEKPGWGPRPLGKWKSRECDPHVVPSTPRMTSPSMVTLLKPSVDTPRPQTHIFPRVSRLACTTSFTLPGKDSEGHWPFPHLPNTQAREPGPLTFSPRGPGSPRSPLGPCSHKGQEATQASHREMILQEGGMSPGVKCGTYYRCQES